MGAKGYKILENTSSYLRTDLRMEDLDVYGMLDYTVQEVESLSHGFKEEVYASTNVGGFIVPYMGYMYTPSSYIDLSGVVSKVVRDLCYLNPLVLRSIIDETSIGLGLRRNLSDYIVTKVHKYRTDISTGFILKLINNSLLDLVVNGLSSPTYPTKVYIIYSRYTDLTSSDRRSLSKRYRSTVLTTVLGTVLSVGISTALEYEHRLRKIDRVVVLRNIKNMGLGLTLNDYKYNKSILAEDKSILRVENSFRKFKTDKSTEKYESFKELLDSSVEEYSNAELSRLLKVSRSTILDYHKYYIEDLEILINNKQ